MFLFVIFFFNQKTAYEMRISDWSSDVCSSDLLVLFSARRETRARYQALFRERAIDKTYEALAPALPGLAFPHVHRSRLVRGEPFFRMREVDGEANSETLIDVIERGTGAWHYRLQPVTGRKHQLDRKSTHLNSSHQC